MSNRKLQFRQWSKNFNRFHYWGDGIDRHTGESKGDMFEYPQQEGFSLAPSEQWTGLYDKNGEKIWEGDIVRMWYDGADGGISVISWNKSGLKLKHPKHDAFGEIYEGCEVIGTMHTHKHLLK